MIIRYLEIYTDYNIIIYGITSEDNKSSSVLIYFVVAKVPKQANALIPYFMSRNGDPMFRDFFFMFDLVRL